ncbi:hypothetical protein EMCRGX_G025976 [Ephydatia muelleri]
MPSASIRDVLVVSLKEEKQNLNDRTMMKASRRVATVEEFYSILEQVHSKDCLHAGSKKTFAKIDLIDMRHLPHDGNKWILHIVDHWSKFNLAYPLPQKTAKEVTNALENSTKHNPFELVFGQPPRSVVVPDARLKGLINEEDLELTGEMESAQDTSDVDRTTVELTLQHNSATTIQHSSLDSTHDSSPTVRVLHSSPSIHNSIHDSAPTYCP